MQLIRKNQFNDEMAHFHLCKFFSSEQIYSYSIHCVYTQMYTKQILDAPTRSAKERKKTNPHACGFLFYLHTYVYKQQTLAYNYFFPGLVLFSYVRSQETHIYRSRKRKP